MPRGKTVDPGKVEVAFVPDENAYRIVERKVETGTVGGQEVSVEVSEFGDRVVWIDDAPDNIADGSGHFEVFDEARHGDAYAASVPSDGEDSPLPDGQEG